MKEVLFVWIAREYLWVPAIVFGLCMLALQARRGYPQHVRRPLVRGAWLLSGGTLLTTLMMAADETIPGGSPFSDGMILGMLCIALGALLIAIGERRAHYQRHSHLNRFL